MLKLIALIRKSVYLLKTKEKFVMNSIHVYESLPQHCEYTQQKCSLC